MSAQEEENDEDYECYEGDQYTEEEEQDAANIQNRNYNAPQNEALLSLIPEEEESENDEDYEDYEGYEGDQYTEEEEQDNDGELITEEEQDNDDLIEDETIANKMSLKRFNQIPNDLMNLCLGFQRLESNNYNLLIPAMIRYMIALFAISKTKHYLQKIPFIYDLYCFNDSPSSINYGFRPGITFIHVIKLNEMKIKHKNNWSCYKQFHMIRFLFQNGDNIQDVRWIDIFFNDKKYSLSSNNNNNEKKKWINNNDPNTIDNQIAISVHTTQPVTCNNKCVENHKMIEIKVNNQVIMKDQKLITSMDSIRLYVECYGNWQSNIQTKHKYCCCECGRI